MSIILNKDIDDKLLVYQKNHTRNLITVLKKNKTALDASDTGTGKTYCAIAACKQLNLKPLILCPKSVISSWNIVCKDFKIEPYAIVNYETIKSGKYYNKGGERVKCPFLDVLEKKIKRPDNQYKIETEFIWMFSEDDKKNIMIIFDEVHKCADISTLNGKLLYTAKNIDTYMLVLSATICDHPENFRLFFYVLNFIEPEQVKRNKIDYNRYQYIMQSWIMRDAKPMWRIHNMLFPDRGSRIRIDALGNLFPETQIIASPYNMDKKREKEIEQEYSKIQTELENLKDKSKKDKSNILVKLLRSHQKIEILKIPLFVQLTNDFIENGYSVVIFVNFTQTLETLSNELYTDCIIYGEQTTESRIKNIERFMENKSKIIICNIKAGGVGISLHDKNGKYPRVSLISPTWSSIDLQQALGRIHRAGGKSKSLQRILYVANTVEEKIADKLQKKLKNINTLNNGDLDLTNIIYERDRKNI
jgi:superfamily II DNA or RNA helicase